MIGKSSNLNIGFVKSADFMAKEVNINVINGKCHTNQKLFSKKKFSKTNTFSEIFFTYYLGFF